MCLLYLYRGKLEQNLKLLGFNTILHFKPSSSQDEEEEGQGIQVGAEFQREKPVKSLQKKFKEKIGEHCKDGAIVFIFVSGLQFPFQVSELASCSLGQQFHYPIDGESSGV